MVKEQKDKEMKVIADVDNFYGLVSFPEMTGYIARHGNSDKWNSFDSFDKFVAYIDNVQYKLRSVALKYGSITLAGYAYGYNISNVENALQLLNTLGYKHHNILMSMDKDNEHPMFIVSDSTSFTHVVSVAPVVYDKR